MTCGRCRGLMVAQADVKIRWRFWRCTACGERTDQLIERNRRAHRHFYQPLQAKFAAELLFQQLINAQSESA